MNLPFRTLLFFFQVILGLCGYCPPPLGINETVPNDIQYYLYLEANTTTYTQLFYGQLSAVKYNQNCPFIFISHGFLDNGFNPWIMNAKNKIFQGLGCANVISVDWSNITSMYNYSNVKSNLNIAYAYTAFRTCCSGKWVADILMEINTTWGVSYSDIILTGHSLGAHLFGCAGQAVKLKTGNMIGRIIGMDPAGPMFTGIEAKCRLSIDDADFVDTIRTNIGMFGYVGPIGHVDYYPNGGDNQPGCLKSEFAFPDLCRHNYAIALLTASYITSGSGFDATLCANYTTYKAGLCDKNAVSQMGYYSLRNARGSYFLDTTATFPYTKNGAVISRTMKQSLPP